MTLKRCWLRAISCSILLSLPPSILSFARTTERYDNNKDWCFQRFETSDDGICYDARPEVTDRKSTESVMLKVIEF
ncbi:hypothetical protein GOQ04_21025 [Emticicia sp. ODNR4P]|jgi:hypothetical protein|nr:hypothetical protein [Emticicia sp. ODNR4P]